MMKSHYITLLVCILFGLQSPIAAQSSNWVYSPYAQYLTNDTTIPPPVGEPADAALSYFRHDTIYVLIMPTGQLYIWLRPDPLLDKYINLSPYVYCNGNPLKYTDPEGMDIFLFDSEGCFTGNIIKQEGDHIGRICYDNDNYMDFSFNDKDDALRICTPFSDEYFSFSGKMDDNAITHVMFVSNEQINEILPKEISQQTTLGKAIWYAWSESRRGKLDFINQPSSFLQNDANVLFIPSDGMNVAYNSFDFGNYLWGQSMQRLNIPLGISLFGANIDNILNHRPLQLDSRADQKAITNGYMFYMIKK